MTHPNPVFNAALPLIQAWLAGCRHSDENLSVTNDYALWDYQRDALGHGTLEIINDPKLTIIPNILALSLDLDLPPVRTAEDAYSLFALVDMLGGVAIVAKGEEGTLSVQITHPLADLTPDILPRLYRHLVAAKRCIEEP